MMRLPELRHLGVYLALRAAAAVVGALPRSWSVRLGELAGATFGRLAGDRRAMVERHARRLGVPERSIRRHVRRTFEAYGRYWAEALWLRPSVRPQIEAGITAEGLEHVTVPRDAGSGMIFVLPHLGNWEYAGPLAESLDIRVVAVAENLQNSRLRDWFVGLRRSLGIEVVLATGSRRVMRALDEAIADGAAVALLCDRDLRGRGVQVEFFGERTTLPAGPATLARRTGAPLIPVAAYFRPDGGHHVVVKAPIPTEDGSEDQGAIADATQRIARELETLILAAPEQWHLLQPNWPSDRETQRSDGDAAE